MSLSTDRTLRLFSGIGMQGKSAIHISRTYMGPKEHFTDQNFWARGFFVSIVGMDEETIQEYIRRQEQEDRRLDQLTMFEG